MTEDIPDRPERTVLDEVMGTNYGALIFGEPDEFTVDDAHALVDLVAGITRRDLLAASECPDAWPAICRSLRNVASWMDGIDEVVPLSHYDLNSPDAPKQWREDMAHQLAYLKVTKP